MKKLFVILSILVIPIIVFYVLKEFKMEQSAYAFVKKDMRPSVIKFSSPMCSECLRMKEVFNSVAPKYDKAVNFSYVSVESADKNSLELAKKYSVNIVPTLILLDKSGNILKKIEGYINERQLDNELKALVNG